MFVPPGGSTLCYFPLGVVLTVHVLAIRFRSGYVSIVSDLGIGVPVYGSCEWGVVMPIFEVSTILFKQPLGVQVGLEAGMYFTIPTVVLGA